MSYGNLKVWRHKALILVKGLRNYSSKSRLGVNLEKLGPLIMNRIAQPKNDPLKPTLPVAREVLRARNALYDGVSILIRHIPVWACKYCPEVYIGESGHLIRTCHGYRHCSNNKVHEWVNASINDVIVPVEVLHPQKIFPDVNERFDHQCIPAVVELCLQVGVDVSDPRVHKLLRGHPVRVCKFCKEVQDARVLVDQGRKYYGHAPAVVDLCSKAGALVPPKYLCMLKVNGFTAT
ncbi:hypothetical protein SASPL_125750 [Salvia splendens]|uniref:APO domain-containing protein n=1 Tax=Salvia splendens TaxID=180675 RepID=A0A8X8ZQG4_SALSN|nr:hypothetical protein SASPL_125750 [Salvia splendens]